LGPGSFLFNPAGRRNPNGKKEGSAMSTYSQTNTPSSEIPKVRKSALKLVRGTKSNALRLSGVAPSEEMRPDTYLAKCETAWIEPVGQGHRVAIQYRVTDGKYDGVALRQWIMAANNGGVVSPTGRHARYCAIALGRPLEDDDPISDPNEIFAGKTFLVTVGYRKTEKPRGGKYDDRLALIPKGEDDYLRVHEILSRQNL
jgi:hypothetical protein